MFWRLRISLNRFHRVGSSDRQRGPIVNAPAGAVEGQTEGDLRVFKGIPYALPPVGAARWKPPVPMPRWDGRQKSNRVRARLLPAHSRSSRTSTPAIRMPMSEDCLSLNIWAPADAHNAPVFFWIHGGALVGGVEQGRAL